MVFSLQCTLSDLNAMALSELHFSLTKLHCTLLSFTSPSMNNTPYSLRYISPSLSYTLPSLSSTLPSLSYTYHLLHSTVSELHSTGSELHSTLSELHPHPLSYATVSELSAVFDLHYSLSLWATLFPLWATVLYRTLHTPHSYLRTMVIGYIFSSVGYVIFLV